MSETTFSATRLCVALFRALSREAIARQMPNTGMARSLRTLVLDLFSLRMARDRNLLREPEASLARRLFGGEALTWTEIGHLLSSFALSRNVALRRPETGMEGLWPLNEYLEAEAFLQALAPLAQVKPGSLKVRDLGDSYQWLLETPFPGEDEEEQKRKELRDARRKLGLFFTPEPIVQRICTLALPKPLPGRAAPTVCDPAMGAGHFLIAMAWHLGQGNPQSARHIAATRLYGVDIDPEAVRLTRISFWLEFSTPLLPFDVPDHFVRGDALIGGLWGMDEVEEEKRLESGNRGFDWYDAFPEVAKKGGFDVIVGNPPYEVLTGFGKNLEVRTTVEYLRGCGLYTFSFGGQLNLYRLFIERAIRLLKKEGLLSFIIPASFLTDKVASVLRRELLLHHGLCEIDHFSESEKGIEDVGQSLVIFLAQKDTGKALRLRIRGNVGTRKEVQRKEQRISTELIETLDATLLPIPMARPADWALLKWLGLHATAHFSDLADGQVGEVDQSVYASHMRDDKGSILVRGCHLSPFAADLSPVPSKQRFLHEEFFLEQKGDAAELCLKRIGRERVVQLGIRNMESRPRMVAARISQRVFLGNSVNFWLPKEGVPAFLLTALLNSSLYDWRFRLTSSNNNINIYEVNTLPLPENVVKYFFDREGLPRTRRNRIALQLDTLQHKVDALERSAQRCAIGGLESGSQPGRRLLEALESAVFDLLELPDIHRRWILDERANG